MSSAYASFVLPWRLLNDVQRFIVDEQLMNHPSFNEATDFAGENYGDNRSVVVVGGHAVVLVGSVE